MRRIGPVLVLVGPLLGAAFLACAQEEDPLQARLRAARGASSIGHAPPSSDDAGAAASADAAALPSAPPSADAATPNDAFGSVAPYALITPPDDSTNHHGGDSNAGKDCLSCHTGEGAPQFVVAGTLFRTAAGTDGVAGAQVRVVAPGGFEVALVGTDSAGNFWLEGTAPLPPGAVVGARDGASSRTMSETIGSGSCNASGCHVAPRPISLQ
jgi:hypothetical protein